MEVGRLLVDTSAYSAFFRGDARAVEALRACDEVYLNAVVVGELLSSTTTAARYDFEGRFERNRYCGNGNNRAMFGFGFFARSLRLGTGAYLTHASTPRNRYPRGSRCTITAVDDELTQPIDAAPLLYYDNSPAPPPTPPILRTLAFDHDVPLKNPDKSDEVLGNTLTVNGVGVGGQRISAYTAASCP